MQIEKLHWKQVEDYLKTDDRCVLPIGSTEQHGLLSLSVDSILSEKISIDAADPLGVPVFPRLNYGICPYFMAYPGTITIQTTTLISMVNDIFSSLRNTGFRRILVVNGHGGNNPVGALASDFIQAHPDVAIKFHNWWMAPKTWAKVQEIDPLASHASWMENFPWTRLKHIDFPSGKKPMVDLDRMRVMPPKAVREYLGDGVFGGAYEKSDEQMLELWDVATEETRELIEGPWE